MSNKETQQMSKYSKLLTDPRWKDKRQVILKRDDYKCTKCERKVDLHVHHLKYYGEYPWSVKDEDLITLCCNCHEEEHKYVSHQNGWITYQIRPGGHGNSNSKHKKPKKVKRNSKKWLKTARKRERREKRFLKNK